MCVYDCACVCSCVRVFVCVRVGVGVCVCTHMHTCTHINLKGKAYDDSVVKTWYKDAEDDGVGEHSTTRTTTKTKNK